MSSSSKPSPTLNSQSQSAGSPRAVVGSGNETETLAVYCRQVAEQAKSATMELASLSTELKNEWLQQVADRLRKETNTILAANQRDLDAAPDYGLSSAQIDRLRLTPERIDEIAKALEEIIQLEDPIGEVLESSTRPSGLEVSRVRVPLGVVFFVYESRPNVTVDAAAICLKSGNAVILRGGKEAAHSSQAFVEIMQAVSSELGIPAGAIQRVEKSDRQAVRHFLQLDQFIDVAIPRGGAKLIEHVTENARMPVLKHDAGNCHVYVDSSADLEMAKRIVIDAKCQRPGVCNACESLLIHEQIADQLLPELLSSLRERGVEIRGDAKVQAFHPEVISIKPEDDDTEYLDLILSVRVVDSLDEAINHIGRHSSGHTEAIITNDGEAADRFCQRVDSSAVMVNASTRLNDGGVLGLGAEIGISTGKIHARGPCGLRELTTYQYRCHGTGQTRA